jgi:hypothetical protein
MWKFFEIIDLGIVPLQTRKHGMSNYFEQFSEYGVEAARTSGILGFIIRSRYQHSMTLKFFNQDGP